MVSGLGCIATMYAQLLQQSKKTLKKKKKRETSLHPVKLLESKASKAPTGPGQLGWALLWMTQLLCSGVASVNPHQPVKIAWSCKMD